MRPVLFVNRKRGFFGGVERYVYDTAALLRANGYRTFGLFEEREGNTDAFDAVFDDVRMVPPEGPRAVLAALAREGVRMAFLHKTDNPDLLSRLAGRFAVLSFVHDHDYHCMRHHKYFPVSRKNCRRPFGTLGCSVCSMLVERRAGTIRPFNPFSRAAVLALIRESRKTAVASAYMRDTLLRNGFPADRVEVLHPFVSVKETGKTAENAVPEILFTGQVIRGKGLDLLVRALASVPVPWRLRIAGKGNDIPFIESLVDEYGLGEKVRFEGWVPDTGPLYRRADIVAVPSRWQEPFGLVGIEACSWKKPVVGFDVGGINEWLTDGVNGFLVPENDLATFADRLAVLLGNPVLRGEFGANGLRLVRERFAAHAFLGRFAEVYDEIAV